MTLADIKAKIENKSARIGVIGLGFVGLPVACMFAQQGFQTIGIDVNLDRVNFINQGQNPIEGIEPGLSDLIKSVIGKQLHCTIDFSEIADVDIFVIAVQTPIDESSKKPHYLHLQKALQSLGAHMKDEVLVIIESTIAPGTMQKVTAPTLETAANGKTFYLGHCPERVTPGRLLRNIRTMNRVVGGASPEICEVMKALYQHIVEGDLDLTDLLTAELVKTTENAYRDVQIAFANEIAMVCQDLGGDVWKVRELVNKLPGRNMLLPGAGVGGHCIPKDSWLLIANLKAHQPQLIPTARAVNRSMPQYTVDLTLQTLQDADIPLSEAIVVVLGYSYMGDSDDTRDTPTQYYLPLITPHVGEVKIQDPFVKEYQSELDASLQGADVAVILVDHTTYAEANWTHLTSLMRHPLIVDARHIIPDSFQPAADVVWRILGQAASAGTDND